MQMWLKVAHNSLYSAVMNMNCINIPFVLVCCCCLSVHVNNHAHSAPPHYCLYAAFICFLIVLWTGHISSHHRLYLYLRHICHSSMEEFDSVTVQTCSHYPSAEHSLNVNVFLGRLHQREILKNNPLIDNMNHQACVPSPLNTSFTISVDNIPGYSLQAITCSHQLWLWRSVFNQVSLGENWTIPYWLLQEKQQHGLYLGNAA